MGSMTGTGIVGALCVGMGQEQEEPSILLLKQQLLRLGVGRFSGVGHFQMEWEFA